MTKFISSDLPELLLEAEPELLLALVPELLVLGPELLSWVSALLL